MSQQLSVLMIPVENGTPGHFEAVQLGESIQPAGQNPPLAPKTDLQQQKPGLSEIIIQSLTCAGPFLT